MMLTGFAYGTDLTQRRTRMRVLGYHSPSARTRSSVSFNGLELELETEKARCEQLKMKIRALIIMYYKRPPIGK